MARKLVSQKKKRYQQDGFDLDLAYVDPSARVMAMGIPSEGTEAAFRNPMSEVVRFLNTKHPCTHRFKALGPVTVRAGPSLESEKLEGEKAKLEEGVEVIVTERKQLHIKQPDLKVAASGSDEVQVVQQDDLVVTRLKLETGGWVSCESQKGKELMQPLQPLEDGIHFKVYNLCIEKDRQYDVGHFDGSVEAFPFYDHNCPPLRMIPRFCESAKAWLDKDESNMIAVHCKAGKSRTGLMIVCLFLHSGIESDPDVAAKAYGEARTNDGKGVTIPSQHRYIHYYRTVLDCAGFIPPTRELRLARIKLVDAPARIGGIGGLLATSDKATFYPHFSCHNGTTGAVGEDKNAAIYTSWSATGSKAWGQSAFKERYQLVEKGLYDGRWKCVQASIVRAGFQHNSKKLADIAKGTILQEKESRRNDDGQLRIKVQLPSKDGGGVGWVSETASDGSSLFAHATDRDYYVIDYDTSDEATARHGECNLMARDDFKLQVFERDDEGASGERLFHTWLHTGFLPEPDDAGKVRVTLYKEQLDKHSGTFKKFPDRFRMELEFDEVSGCESRADSATTAEETAFRALKEERLPIFEAIMRNKKVLSTNEQMNAKLDASAAEIEAELLQKAGGLVGGVAAAKADVMVCFHLDIYPRS